MQLLADISAPPRMTCMRDEPRSCRDRARRGGRGYATEVGKRGVVHDLAGTTAPPTKQHKGGGKSIRMWSVGVEWGIGVGARRTRLCAKFLEH